MALIGLRFNISEVFDMKYLTGIYALNIENSLNTCGDWHTSALDWNKIELQESDKSIFKDWGIELNKRIPCHTELYAVANDLRAILDLMESGKTSWLKGFKNDFLCTDEYNTEFFNKVLLLKESKHWKNIDVLMKREFMNQWEEYCGEIAEEKIMNISYNIGDSNSIERNLIKFQCKGDIKALIDAVYTWNKFRIKSRSISIILEYINIDYIKYILSKYSCGNEVLRILKDMYEYSGIVWEG